MGYQRRSNTNNNMDDDQDGGGQRRNNKRRFARKRVCEFCVSNNKVIDYKNADEMKRYVSEYGRIRPRRQTGACAKHQREVAVAVKRARHIALLPFVVE
jgi:small subunit ribosomal protein S18